jgi:hypothetical protein
MFAIAVVLWSIANYSFAVDATEEPLVIEKRANVDITVDGVMDEPVWASVPYFGEFVVIEPDTLAGVPYETRIHMFYTTRGLYVGVWNEQPKETLIARLSSRDQFISRDQISFTLDPSGEGLYGYWFSVNLGDTLLDGTVLPERQFSNQWDGPWYGDSAEHEEGWSAEFFIPWSMMSMPESPGTTRRMGFYLSRNVANINERWGYPALPPTKPRFMSALQQLEFEGVAPRQQFTFYPYASSTYDNAAASGKDRYKAGFDIFWRPSTNLQLSATVNPDFGNVESDNVVVNLSSFETFFPEKRAFFLEGNEIFVATPRARSGRGQRGSPTTLVNTRRIGGPPVYPDLPGFDTTALEENQPSELVGAAKVTGQLGRLRYGVFAAAEDETVINGEVAGTPTDYVQDGRNFGAGRILYEDTSTGGRRAIGLLSTIVAHPQRDAVANAVDFHNLSPDGKWNVDGQVMHSHINDSTGAGSTTGYGGFTDFTYTPARGYKHTLQFEYFDDELEINDFGFIRRNDTVGARYGFNRTESDLSHLKNRFTNIRVSQDYNTDGKVVRSGLFMSQERIFKNDIGLFTELNYFPERWDDINSDGNGAFRIDQRFQTGVWVGTDESKKVRLAGGFFAKNENLGDISTEGEIEVIWRPTDRFSLLARINHERKDGWLIHWTGTSFSTFGSEIWRPKIEADFFISARQQFRVTAQWAGIKAFEQDRWDVPVGDGNLVNTGIPANASHRDFSISRLTFQARYRWEIAPLSDLFVVYTRGSNVPSRPFDSFENLLRSSWTEPLVDVFVIKLRYRLGS